MTAPFSEGYSERIDIPLKKDCLFRKNYRGEWEKLVMMGSLTSQINLVIEVYYYGRMAMWTSNHVVSVGTDGDEAFRVAKFFLECKEGDEIHPFMSNPIKITGPDQFTIASDLRKVVVDDGLAVAKSFFQRLIDYMECNVSEQHEDY